MDAQEFPPEPAQEIHHLLLSKFASSQDWKDSLHAIDSQSTGVAYPELQLLIPDYSTWWSHMVLHKPRTELTTYRLQPSTSPPSLSVTGIYIPITWASDQSPTELFLPHLTYPSPFISLSKLLFLKLARMAGDHANYSKNISQIIPIPKRYYPPYWESNVSWIHSLF